MWMKFQFARGVVKHTSLFLLYLHVQYSTYLSVRGKHEEVKVYDGRLFLYSSKWAFASCMRFSAASYCGKGYNEAHKPHCTCKAISWKLLLILTGGVIFSCFHAHTHTDAPMRCLPPGCRQEFNICGVSWSCWALQRLPEGLQRVSDLQAHNPRDGGCCVATAR